LSCCGSGGPLEDQLDDLGQREIPWIVHQRYEASDIWFDHFLAGACEGLVGRQSPIVEPVHDHADGQREGPRQALPPGLAQQVLAEVDHSEDALSGPMSAPKAEKHLNDVFVAFSLAAY
jgi:hypothetical protein